MTNTDHNPASPQVQDHADRGPPRNTPALQKKLSEVIAEYDAKLASIPAELAAFEQAGTQLKTS